MAYVQVEYFNNMAKVHNCPLNSLESKKHPKK